MIDKYVIENNLNSGKAVFDTHLHDIYEINFMMTDNVEVIIEDKFFLSQRGDIFIFPPYTFHRIDSKKMPFSRFLMFFDENTMLSASASLSQAISLLKRSCPPVIHMSEAKSAGLISVFTKAYDAFKSDGRFHDLKNISLFGEILCFILENSDSCENVPTLVPASKISKILTYVNKNLDENLNIEKIAEKFGISTTTLWHMSKDCLGMSLKAYILKMRIARATQLLRDGLSVTEVSNRSGFNSYAHFIRTFTKSVGISPYKYAKNPEKMTIGKE